MKKVKIYIQNDIILDAQTNSKEDFITSGNLVFTTSMTGYQEVITDPSYAGQIVVMTYPLIGNYGINNVWNQSNKIFAKGMIVQNIDAENGFINFLDEQNIPLIYSIDTRNLTHLIRELFYPKCVISTKELNQSEVSEYFEIINQNVVNEISTKTVKIFNGNIQNNKKIGVLDFGLKYGIIEELKQYFSQIYILPYNYEYNDIKNFNLDCILLSNGPGDPTILVNVIENIKNFLGKIDIYGICLGHQILSLAMDCKTQMMEFGHRGANHPVINIQTGKIIITSQNHGYEIIENSLNNDVIVTHRNLHDNSIEGIKSLKYNAQSVQFHPEASPGPNDAAVVFEEWFKNILA